MDKSSEGFQKLRAWAREFADLEYDLHQVLTIQVGMSDLRLLWWCQDRLMVLTSTLGSDTIAELRREAEREYPGIEANWIRVGDPWLSPPESLIDELAPEEF